MTPAAHLARAMSVARFESLVAPRYAPIAAPMPGSEPEPSPPAADAGGWFTPTVSEAKLRLRELLYVVAMANDLTVNDLRGRSRARHIVCARQEFFWRAACGRASYCQIGAFLNRDHTTAMHGIGQHCRRHGLPMPRYGIDLAEYVDRRLRDEKARRTARLAAGLTMEQSP